MTVEFSLLCRWHGLVKEEVDWGGVTRPGRSMLLDIRQLLRKGWPLVRAGRSDT